jgi:sigma-B regulation protein RsbU (phosphoserine phosphatase)
MDTPAVEELQKENNRLRKTVEDLSAINQLANIINSTMPVEKILNRVVEVSVKAIKAEQGTISLLDEKQTTGDPFKTLIRKVDMTQPQGQFRLDDHLSGWMVSNRRPLMINDLSNDQTFRGYQPANQSIRSLLSVPLLCKGKLIGVVNLFNKKDNREFTEDDQRLFAIIASQSAQVVENARLYEEEKRLRKFEHELQMAREIQERLLPKRTPEAKRLDIASYFNPATQVGGDYFDYFDLGEDRLGLVMADVSGHGTSAALVMTMVKGIMHAITLNYKSPEAVLKEMNAIVNQIGPREKFVTMTFLVFDLSASQVCFSNAGHNPIVFHQKKAKQCEMLELPGPALGLSKLSPYQQKVLDLTAGDLIMIYTDGITESFNKKGEMFEESRLLTAVAAASAKRSSEVIDHVKSEILKFTDGAQQSDDMAMIVAKVL